MSKVWGGFLTVTGFIACPCHLPLTLPLLLGVLGGTAAGSFIGANKGLIYGIATGYFVLGMGLGIALLRRKRTGVAACVLPNEPPAGALRNAEPQSGHGEIARAP